MSRRPTPRPVVIERKDVELWAADISTSTSSPILVGDMVYVVAEKGDLCAVNANTGEIKWKLKLGIEQRNSCPFYADGKLYVPMLDNPGGKGAGDSARGRDQGRVLHHQARRSTGDAPARRTRRSLLRHARRLQRQALHADDEVSVLLGQDGQQPRPAAEVNAEPWPASRPGQVPPDHPFRSHACAPARVLRSAPASWMRMASSSKTSRI